MNILELNSSEQEVIKQDIFHKEAEHLRAKYERIYLFFLKYILNLFIFYSKLCSI